MQRVLILGMGNSARSQMAEELLRRLPCGGIGSRCAPRAPSRVRFGLRRLR